MGLIINAEHEPAKPLVSQVGFITDGGEILSQLMQVKVAGSGLELNNLIFHMIEKLGQGIHQRSIVLLFGMHKI